MPTTKLNGTEIYFEIIGEGEPVAFLNGVMMSAQAWVMQTAFFRSRYQSLLHDFRGQLLSGKPDEPYSLAQHAEDFCKLLDYLGIEKCHVVGTSYGGEVGMIFAHAYPARIKSLSVIASVSYSEPLLRHKVALWAETAAMRPEGLYRLVATDTFSNRFLAENPDLIQQGEERLKGHQKNFFSGFTRLCEAFLKLDITARLVEITCPTLVVCAQEDILKPPFYSRTIAETISNAEFLLIPDAGHGVILEKPEAVNTVLLGFIEKNR